MDNYTIAESYTLPSQGKVYQKQINPNVKLRSMTTQDEMKRLSHSDLAYKPLAEIIDDCLIEKPGISCYDMCIGDYQYLLYKLRTVTYGPEYKVETICPICGTKHKDTLNLDNLTVIEYSEDLKKYLSVTLPKSQKILELRLQTPRMLDEIRVKSSEILNSAPNMQSEPAFLLTLQSLIYKVDGQVLDAVKLESFVRRLPMADVNYILKSIEKINIGIDTNLSRACKKCKQVYHYTFPITGEFFGPSID
jgi:hypothetical protein